jgi:hypothetical protein
MTADSDQRFKPANLARERSRQLIERHHRGILLAWMLLLLCLLLAAAEALLRYTVSYRPDYYTGTRVSNRLIRYPFGNMPFNSDGYPDREWDRADPRMRVGFWGDSITSGFGAGFGYRYTDLIRASRQDRYYMNFGGTGEDGIADDQMIEKILVIAQRFRLGRIIYAMDLNDILPDKGAAEARHSKLHRAMPLVKQYLDVLRTRSYVYNYLRSTLARAAVRMGYGYHGAVVRGRVASVAGRAHKSVAKRAAGAIDCRVPENDRRRGLLSIHRRQTHRDLFVGEPLLFDGEFRFVLAALLFTSPLTQFGAGAQGHGQRYRDQHTHQGLPASI